MDWTSYFRQLFLCSGPWTVYFMSGLCIGFPTVLVPQLRRANYTIGIEQTSWLMTTHVYSAIPWALVLSALLVAIGRKKSQIIVCSGALFGFIISYFSTSIIHFYIGQIFLGTLASSHITTNVVVLTEYTSSNYRGVFITVKSATFYWGILVSNIIGTYFHWQNIVLLSMVCNVYAILNIVIWPESPLWLANKGMFIECSAAHRWLKGSDSKSENELKKLIETNRNRVHVKQKWDFRHFISIFMRKQFYKPILLSILLICLMSFSGKLICTVFAIDILKKISSDESAAYSGMLILDAVTVASMYLGCTLSIFLRRRTLLLGFSTVGVICMIVISSYLYLVARYVFNENKYFSLFLLALYSISTSCGPLTMSTAIMGELLPLENRVLSLCVIGLALKIILGILTICSPLFFNNLGIHGSFLIFAILSFVCCVLVYFYIPETKDKTLQEIDECLRGEERKATKESKLEEEEGSKLEKYIDG